MRYLNDTCVFIHKICIPEKFTDIVQHSNKHADVFCVTDVVVDELSPGWFVPENEAKNAEAMINVIDLYYNQSKIEVINVKNQNKYNENFKEIRERYYKHLTDRLEIEDMISRGECTREEAKYLRYKDYGECSCLAVAIEHPGMYCIVSEDGGKVCKKPDINIFKIHEKKGIRVIDYNTWTYETRYGMEEKRKKGRY